MLQDDGDCVGRLKGEGAGVGGVVGDERGDALEDDPLVRGRPVDEVRAEEPAVSGGDGGSARGCRASASGRRDGGAPSR